MGMLLFQWHREPRQGPRNHEKGGLQKLQLDHNCKYQQDNEPKHTAKVVNKWIKYNDVIVLEWPSHSPDMNRDLKTRVMARKPTNLTQLYLGCRQGRLGQHPTGDMQEACGHVQESSRSSHKKTEAVLLTMKERHWTQ